MVVIDGVLEMGGVMDKERLAGNLELVGGDLCLDFVNTVSTRDETMRLEYLNGYDDLVGWARHTEMLTEPEAETLLHSAARHPDLAAAVLERALGLRETIYRLFSAIVEDREPEGTDLAAVNAAFHEASARLEIVPSAGGFEWTWVVDEDELDRVLWPIARSAGDLLTAAELGRVRQCARQGCDWLFVDLSKNQSRRWCSMNMCGSRVKSRRYYRRRKQKG
jgi:predicted RNA-binding Zn ribbon-like protein